MPSNYLSLNQNKDFLRIYYRGKSCAKPGVVVYAFRNKQKASEAQNTQFRIGVTTSKKIGNAVERNRSKRVIVAAWQDILKNEELCEKVSSKWDFVFVARNKTKFLKSTVIKKRMLDCLKRLDVF